MSIPESSLVDVKAAFVVSGAGVSCICGWFSSSCVAAFFYLNCFESHTIRNYLQSWIACQWISAQFDNAKYTRHMWLHPGVLEGNQFVALSKKRYMAMYILLQTRLAIFSIAVQ
eukprot:15337754-Ditylum_brightwellii.AAC.1